MGFATRREDRAQPIAGFFVLMTIMTAHSVMETARDTLFLTTLPASALPRAYLLIAVLAIVELAVHGRILPHVRERRVLLAASLIFGSLVTLGFWALLGELGPWAPFGFYVWTGLLITVVLVEFWLLVDDAVTLPQAKRWFPAIAAGGVTGAMLGSALSEGLLRLAGPEVLVLAAAGLLALAASAVAFWKTSGHPGDDESVERVPSLGAVLADGYLSRVLSWVFLGTVALTVVDFVFKSTVAQHLSSEGLGPFFARFYLGLNSIALVLQIVGTGWLVRGFGVARASALLPMLILGGAIGLIVGPTLPFAVALKAADGSLRHTLYRGSVELLFLPLDSRRRERAKGVVDVFGHRVGQAVASVLIIGALAIGLSTAQLGIALIAVVVFWLAMIGSTRHRYVECFRARLRQGESHDQSDGGELAIDEALLDEQLAQSLQRIVWILQRRASIDGSAKPPPDVEALRTELGREEQASLERAFRLIGQRHPEEDFSLVWRGLRSGNPSLRAASIEVLEAALGGRLREAVLALVDDGATAARRARTAADALGLHRDLSH